MRLIAIVHELGGWEGETERNVRAMDKILDLTEADHDRWGEKAAAEARFEAEAWEGAT